MSQMYEELVNETNKYGLHERTALALLEAASPSRVRNASYRVSAGVSNNLASRDLKALVDAGFLIPKGERRGRHYVASDIVMKVRNRNRLPRGGVDPFADDEINPKLIQEFFFEAALNASTDAAPRSMSSDLRFGFDTFLRRRLLVLDLAGGQYRQSI